jgi:hypothetical protein
MNEEKLLDLLRQIQQGQITPESALSQLSTLPFEDLEIAKLDHHRAIRCGFGEVVFGAGKSSEELRTILSAFEARESSALVTRCSHEQLESLLNFWPNLKVNRRAGTARLGKLAVLSPQPAIAIAAAGTSDLGVAEEARETLLHFGVPVEMFTDIGVAGLHRLLHHLPQLRNAPVIIAIAGMEGALPSVIGGLVSAPVIAVPTSVGYGASFQGLTALLAMLNSCASGISVVNIDNGFGAAAAAMRILNRLSVPLQVPPVGLDSTSA